MDASRLKKELDEGTGGIELAPLRSLDDFLLAEARFQLPMKNVDRWGNRVICNFMYYQTNYFILGLLTFLIVGLLHPVEMAWGIFALALTVSLFGYVGSSQHQIKEFKQNHPIVTVILVLTAAYMIVALAGAVVTFIFGVALPLALMFLHASLRMRNLKNKLTGRIEKIYNTAGMRRTPMGQLLDWLVVALKLGEHERSNIRNWMVD